jgi:hypothetical protein
LPICSDELVVAVAQVAKVPIANSATMTAMDIDMIFRMAASKIQE